MLKQFIIFLKCIDCNCSELQLDTRTQEDDHVIDGSLTCSNCKRAYPIVKGVPYLLEDNIGTSEEQTKNSFGWQWVNAEKEKLQIPVSQGYFRSFFPDFTDCSLIKDRVILDAGCGNGRLVAYLQGNTETNNTFIGLDFSDAVHVAFERTRELENVFIVRADLLQLPIRREVLDTVYSLGVIHHVSDPVVAVNNLALASRRDAGLHLWTYSYEGNELYCRIASLARKMTVSLPKRVLWGISKLIGLSTWWYLCLCNRWPKGLFMGEYLKFIHALGFRVYHLVIFDQLSPQIAFYPTRKEVLRWVSCPMLNLCSLSMRTNNSWCLHLRKT